MVKKHKSGAYKITVPLYGRSFYLATSLEVAEKLTGDAHEDVTMGAVVEYEGDPPLMLLLDPSHGTIAHECAHVALVLMEAIGMRGTYEDQEPFAYLLGYIAEQVYGVLEK